ncbi:MAG TPA: hypothetical protein VNQ73_14815 [Ilumatobacter sp.]|nr:hypothetical protein [Ilumatobacter sp.]
MSRRWDSAPVARVIDNRELLLSEGEQRVQQAARQADAPPRSSRGKPLKQIVTHVPNDLLGRFKPGDEIFEVDVVKWVLPTRWVPIDGSPLEEGEQVPTPRYVLVNTPEGPDTVATLLPGVVPADWEAAGRRAASMTTTGEPKVTTLAGRRTAEVAAELDGCVVRVEVTVPADFDGINLYSLGFRQLVNRAARRALVAAERSS